jgi:hypothetical protein
VINVCFEVTRYSVECFQILYGGHTGCQLGFLEYMEIYTFDLFAYSIQQIYFIDGILPISEEHEQTNKKIHFLIIFSSSFIIKSLGFILLEDVNFLLQ